MISNDAAATLPSSGVAEQPACGQFFGVRLAVLVSIIALAYVAHGGYSATFTSYAHPANRGGGSHCLLAQASRVAPLSLRAALATRSEAAAGSVLLLIALAPKHFELAIDVLARPLPPVDVAFVFSTQADAVLFGDALAADFAARLSSFRVEPELHNAPPLPPAPYTALVVDTFVNASDLDRLGAIGIKFYFGIAVAHACYDLIVRLDAEFTIIQPAYVVPHIRALAAAGRVFSTHGNFSEVGVKRLNRDAEQYFNEREREQILRLTLNYTRFSWFSTPPIYVARDVPAFLLKIRIANEPAEFNPLVTMRNWDYQSYELWKLLRGDFVYADLTDTLGRDEWLENVDSAAFYSHVAHRFPPGLVWARPRLCGSVRPRGCDTGPLFPSILFHIDRNP